MEYTRKQVEKIIGMTSVRVRLYGDRGLLTLGEQFPGRGVGRVYTWVNLLELGIINEFSKHGLELAAINRILKFIKEHYPEILQKSSYVGDKPRFYLISYSSGTITAKGSREDETISTILQDECSAIIVDVTKVVALLP